MDKFEKVYINTCNQIKTRLLKMVELGQLTEDEANNLFLIESEETLENMCTTKRIMDS